MRITIDIGMETWAEVASLLSPYVVEDDVIRKYDVPINVCDILALKNGVRIYNILKDCNWSKEYTCVGEMLGDVFLKDKKCYTVRTVADLRRITREEFLKHRNAGIGAWESLKAYIETL